MDYELVVIGGGAAGMGTARAGVRHGKRTVLVQDGAIGGDCTFTGCVPSKALIAAAARGATFASAMQHARDTIKQVAAAEDVGVLRGEGIDVVQGRARFVSSHEVEVDGERIGADRFVIATGAVPEIPPISGLRELAPLTSETIWDAPDAPASIAVLGGGAVGCELAQALARLGVRTTLIETLPRVLAEEEPGASSLAQAALTGAGVDVRTGQSVSSARRRGAVIVLELDGGDVVEAAEVLVATGRRPVTDGLDLDAAGVDLDEHGFVVADDHLLTSRPHIYAVGDVAGKLQLTHAADEMARIAVGNAFSGFRRRRFRAGWVPSVTYLDPEIARVGMSEAEAAELDPSAEVAELPMDGVDRAIAEGRTEGFIKVICGQRAVLGRLAGGRVLGATIAAPRAGELIHELVLARRTGMFPARLALTSHAYPTWSVAVQQVMAQFFVEIDGRRARPARPG